jgi:ATP-dependent DNA helicase UvrD/PcrA
MTLTPEQQNFAEHPEEAFVQACPGAGKTRTVLGRIAHISTSLPPRQGIAVLSFTNRAIEEFKNRAAAEHLGLLLRHPGFIGTFDAFVRHFLFLPAGVPGSPVKPHVVDSWASLPIDIRLNGRNTFPGPGVGLDLFDPESHVIDPDRISHNGLRGHVRRFQADYERAAQSRHQHLNRQGYFSAGDARVMALERIRRPDWGRALGNAIAGRFREIIVDEAQDCNPLDLEILSWLRSHGIRVTLVCDMDQSIYAFRDGERMHLERFAQSYRIEDRLTLTGNFRSSPAICNLAASLRRNTTSDTSLGDSRDIEHPISIYVYPGQIASADIGHWFISLAGDPNIDIPPADLIVLAHSERAARLASGSFYLPPSGTSKIEQLACAVGEFWAGTTKYSRARALSSFEKFLLDITDQRNPGESVSRAAERLGLNQRLLRRQALEFATRLPKTCPDNDESRLAWGNRARTIVQELGLTLPRNRTVGMLLRTPRNKHWSRHLEQADIGTNLRYSTIHNAKGGEYKGVCVVIPPDDHRRRTTQLFDAWDQRSDHEPSRVIYVGVTRAMNLAALAVPTIFFDRCVAILTQRDVPYQVFRSGSPA